MVNWAVIGCVCAALWPWAADAACRQALSLGLDVSGSVDRTEYGLQINGVAEALRDPEVQKAFTALPEALVRLHIYEWAGTGSKRVLIDWVEIATSDDLNRVSQRLFDLQGMRPREPGTALGTALLYGAQALASHPDCWRRTLDISADGPSNTGPRPRDVEGDPLLSDVTVNALVIGSSLGQRDTTKELSALATYFSAEVIRGPQAFVEITASYADYRDAIAKKLVRELQTFAIGILMQRTPQGEAG